MEWSLRVLHHGIPEMWKFFKKFEIDEIEFVVKEMLYSRHLRVKYDEIRYPRKALYWKDPC